MHDSSYDVQSQPFLRRSQRSVSHRLSLISTTTARIFFIEGRLVWLNFISLFLRIATTWRVQVVSFHCLYTWFINRFATLLRRLCACCLATNLKLGFCCLWEFRVFTLEQILRSILESFNTFLNSTRSHKKKLNNSRLFLTQGNTNLWIPVNVTKARRFF